jgi:ABC-type lipoprotein release transport system permease subunit
MKNMTGIEIIMLLLISINALVIAVELISWTKYMNGLDKEKKANEYLNSEQFQIDKQKRLDETYKAIDRLREQKDAELLCKSQKGRKSKPTPKGRNMIDKL